MRILINLSIIQSGGGLQVAHSFVSELGAFHDHRYCILISPRIRSIVNPAAFPNNFEFRVIAPSPSSVSNGRKGIRQLEKAENEFQPDVIFTLFGPSYWKPNVKHLCGFALAQHLYKESPYFSIIPFSERILLFIRELVKVYSFRKHCDYWVTETRDVANRLAGKLKVSRRRIFTVNNVYNGIYDEPTQWKRPKVNFDKDIRGFKLITISSFHIHKNLTIIPNVIDYLCEQYPDFEFTFVLSVKEDKFPSLSTQQKAHMFFLGTVALDECPLLYEQADALFMPTLLECFTVSYLEAMKMDKPILTSDLPFANDICQDAAVYFEPMNPKDIGDKIIKLATDNALQEDLIQNGRKVLKGFGTATDRARSYIEILEKIAEDKTT